MDLKNSYSQIKFRERHNITWWKEKNVSHKKNPILFWFFFLCSPTIKKKQNLCFHFIYFPTMKPKLLLHSSRWNSRVDTKHLNVFRSYLIFFFPFFFLTSNAVYSKQLTKKLYDCIRNPNPEKWKLPKSFIILTTKMRHDGELSKIYLWRSLALWDTVILCKPFAIKRSLFRLVIRDDLGEEGFWITFFDISRPSGQLLSYE